MTYTILLEGLVRIEVQSLVQHTPYIIAEVAALAPSKVASTPHAYLIHTFSLPSSLPLSLLAL